MKLKVAILGSTGFIGKSLLNIISKNLNNFKVVFLSANKNYKTILKQAEKFKVENIVITNSKYFKLANSINKFKKIKIHNNFENFEKIFPKKIDYVMSSIVGINGLTPTFKIIKYTRKIAIANKETIICAWNLIKKELIKYNTKFIPVDSEHFSIWYAIQESETSNLNQIYLTASGGPLLNLPKNQYNKLKINEIINHPNWKMGPKISVDSSNMMNKVFEIVEAKKIFNINYSKLKIIVHPTSYVHALVKFNDGMIKIIAHDTTMEIPIYNSLYFNQQKKMKTKKIDFIKLNNLNFQKINENKFPSIKILKNLPNKDSLYETALVTANDEFVNLYLKNKINYNTILPNILRLLNDVEIKKLKKIIPTTISQVINTSINVQKKISLMNIN